MQVPALIQKHCRFVVLLLSTFSGFSFLPRVFSFAVGNFSHYCVVLLNAPMSDRDRKNLSEKGYFSREIFIYRH